MCTKETREPKKKIQKIIGYLLFYIKLIIETKVNSYNL